MQRPETRLVHADENQLIEFAEGLLGPEAAAKVADHLDSCSECRLALAGVAQATTLKRVESPRALAPQPLRDLLRAALVADAPNRERLSLSFILIFATFGLLIVAGTTLFGVSNGASPWMSLAGILYSSTLLMVLRRGWYHRSISWLNQAYEVSIPTLILLHVGHNLGVANALAAPVQLFFGVMVLWSGIRMSPALSFAAGCISAVEITLLWWWWQPQIPPSELVALQPFGAALRAIQLVMLGAVAAAVARYALKRTEDALRAVREQDLMGKYVLHERLGEGGMGEVFRASYCPEGGFVKTVALKRLPTQLSADPIFVELLREEARTGAMLSHPNIVQVLDCGRFRGNFILVMEYVDGVALSSLMRRLQRPLELEAVTFIASELADALEYLHRRRGADGRELGLVHRDVNAPNVMLSKIGEVKLSDFGVAHATRHAAVKGFAGKVEYAAPEQLKGGPLDGRADLFALGLMLFELLTGQRVYEVRRDADGRLPRPSALRPDVPAPLEELVQSLIEERPESRPQSAAEVRARLNALPPPLQPSPKGEAAVVRAITAALGAPPELEAQAASTVASVNATMPIRHRVT